MIDASRKKDTFVGVALSGGGSRSANFSLRVIQDLEAMGIMQNVTALSSTSGGSIAAAYYAAFRGENNFWDSVPSVFRQDLAKEAIVHHFFNPHTWIDLIGTTYNRTDSLVYALDSLFFHGKTFAELGPPSTNAPNLYINATAIVSPISSAHIFARGANSWTWGYETFVFTEDATDDLGIELSKMRLSQAVAASAAYPGVLQTVSLRQYKFPEKSYLQLIDGGLSDNLAIKALIDAAIAHARKYQTNDNRYGGCLLILADAHVEERMERRPFSGDLSERLQFSLLDQNLEDAFDALLIQRRNEQLLSVGIDLAARTKSGNYERVNEKVNIPLRKQSFRDCGTGTCYDSNDPAPTRTAITCAVWHLSLNDLFSIPHGSSPTPAENKSSQPATALQVLMGQVQTDFRLTMKSPGTCTSDDIQQAIFSAADLVTLGDSNSRSTICNWLAKRGLVNEVQCEISPPLYPVTNRLDIEITSPDQLAAHERKVSCSGH